MAGLLTTSITAHNGMERLSIQRVSPARALIHTQATTTTQTQRENVCPDTVMRLTYTT